MQIIASVMEQQAPVSIPGEPTAFTPVVIRLTLGGRLPDLVQIYAAPPGTGGLRHLVDVLVAPTQREQERRILLPAGQVLNISVCPRTKTGDTLDDRIDGQYWEGFCANFSITTLAPPGSGQLRRLQSPTFTGSEAHAATVTGPARITVRWKPQESFSGHFNLRHARLGTPERQIELTDRSYTLEPVQPGRYRISVQQCWRHTLFRDSRCSAWTSVEVDAAPPTRSLRRFFGPADPSRGIREHVPGGSVRRRMGL